MPCLVFHVDHESLVSTSLVSLNGCVNGALLHRGEKVAGGRMGAIVKGRVLKIPPRPSPFPQSFASILPSDNPLCLRKNRGRGGHMVLSREKVYWTRFRDASDGRFFRTQDLHGGIDGDLQ